MNETKRTLETLSIYDPEAVVRRLETMAQRGWLIQRMDYLGWHYQRIEPQVIRFAVTYDPKVRPAAGEEAEGDNVVDFCARNGWTRVLTWEQLVVYRHEEADPPPLEVDPAQALEALETADSKERVLVWTLLLLAGLLFTGMLFAAWYGGGRHLLYNRDFLLHPIEGCLYLLLAVVELGWCIRGLRGGDDAYQRFLHSPFRRWLRRGVLAALAVCMGYKVLTIPLTEWIGFWDLMVDMAVLYFGSQGERQGRMMGLGTTLIQILCFMGLFLVLLVVAMVWNMRVMA